MKAKIAALAALAGVVVLGGDLKSADGGIILLKEPGFSQGPIWVRIFQLADNSDAYVTRHNPGNIYVVRDFVNHSRQGHLCTRENSDSVVKRVGGHLPKNIGCAFIFSGVESSKSAGEVESRGLSVVFDLNTYLKRFTGDLLFYVHSLHSDPSAILSSGGVPRMLRRRFSDANGSLRVFDANFHVIELSPEKPDLKYGRNRLGSGSQKSDYSNSKEAFVYRRIGFSVFLVLLGGLFLGFSLRERYDNWEAGTASLQKAAIACFILSYLWGLLFSIPATWSWWL